MSNMSNTNQENKNNNQETPPNFDVDRLISVTNDAENFLAYVKAGMIGEYDKNKKYSNE